MALINSFLASIRQDEEGQGLAEYALILALIAIVAIIALIFLGNQVSSILLDGRQLDLAMARRRSRHNRFEGRRSPRRPSCVSASDGDPGAGTHRDFAVPVDTIRASAYLRPRHGTVRGLSGKGGTSHAERTYFAHLS